MTRPMRTQYIKTFMRTPMLRLPYDVRVSLRLPYEYHYDLTFVRLSITSGTQYHFHILHRILHSRTDIPSYVHFLNNHSRIIHESMSHILNDCARIARMMHITYKLV
jgi:hypothetical protein